MRHPVLACGGLVAASLIALGSCGGRDRETATSASAPPPATATSTVAPSSSTIAPPSTIVATSTSTIAASTTQPPYPTTTVHRSPPSCEDELVGVLGEVDGSISAARLAPGGAWTADIDGASFASRTNTAEEFRYRMGLDCTALVTQTTADGGERLVLVAWTGDRMAWVVQASDAPASPFRPDQLVQLFIDQPTGEWLVDQFVWAGSLSTGETVLVGTNDTAFGVAAKSWWNEVPRFDDLEVTNGAERYAIDALIHAGARNVSVGEPANFQSEIATIQFITPAGLHLIATVAPPDWFDPAAPIVEGEMVVEQIDGVDVHVTTAAPGSYATGLVGWACGDYVWFIDSVYGTVGELVDWTGQLVASAGC